MDIVEQTLGEVHRQVRHRQLEELHAVVVAVHFRFIDLHLPDFHVPAVKLILVLGGQEVPQLTQMVGGRIGLPLAVRGQELLQIS